MKKQLSLLCVFVLIFSALCVFTGCNEENKYFWIDYSGNSFRYENSALNENFRFSPRIENDRKLIGIYTADGTKVFDENGKICDLSKLKSMLQGKKGVTERSIRLYAETEKVEIHFNLVLKTDGGATRWGDEPPEGDVVYENLSLEEAVAHPENYFPEYVFKKGAHFLGWKQEYGYKDGVYDEWANEQSFKTALNSVADGDTLCYQAFYEDPDVPYPYYYVIPFAYDSRFGWKQIYSPFHYFIGETFTKHLECNVSGYQNTTREHTVFKWSVSSAAYVPFNGVAEGDMEIYLYEVDYKTCTLNPMTGDQPLQYTVLLNDDTSLVWDVAAPDGYTFAGWYTTRDYTGEAVSLKEIPAYDEIEYGKTYYAKWEKQA